MKILRKYANMAFLLLSVATIVPVYASLEDKYDIFKERMIQQSKRPEMLKKIFEGVEVAGVVGMAAFILIASRLYAKKVTELCRR